MSFGFRAFKPVVLLILLLTGCGGGQALVDQPQADPANSTAPVSEPGGLPAPTDALAADTGRTTSGLLLERTGNTHGAGLAQRVDIELTSARFNPVWGAGARSVEQLAWAIYQFNVQTYSGPEYVVLEWGSTPADTADLWIGISDWTTNSWDWYPGPAEGTLDLQDVGYGDYTRAGTGEMLVAVVMLGTDTPLLDMLRVGETALEDWKMFGHDLQHTRRSPYIGSQTNNVKWSFATAGEVHASPTIGPDGTVYVGSYDGSLYAVNPDGTEKWSISIGGLVESSAAVGADGTIYVGASTPVKKLFAINPDGTEKWSFSAAGNVNSSPAIGADGTIYVGCGSNKFYAINSDGTEKWSVPQAGIAESSPAIAEDGTIYIGGTDLLALNPDGTEQWTFATDGVIRASPAIGADGTIYAGTPNNFFYAVNSDGSEKWVFEADFEIASSAAIGVDGTIYIGSFGNSLYALNPDSSVKWESEPGGNIWSSPAIDAEGTLYVGVSFGGSEVQGINADGSLKWSYATGGMVNSSPAIGADGTLYIGSHDGKLYAFGPAL